MHFNNLVRLEIGPWKIEVMFFITSLILASILKQAMALRRDKTLLFLRLCRAVNFPCD
jgi:hypothetical protein